MTLAHGVTILHGDDWKTFVVSFVGAVVVLALVAAVSAARKRRPRD